jgi:hypothetical protein
MISYEEVEMEQDLRNRKTATEEIEKAKVFAEKEARAKADYARYNGAVNATMAVSSGQATESFIDFNGVRNRSCEIVVVLLNQGKAAAMLQALSLFNLVFLATSYGQKDSEVLANEAQKISRLLMSWPDH